MQKNNYLFIFISIFLSLILLSCSSTPKIYTTIANVMEEKISDRRDFCIYSITPAIEFVDLLPRMIFTVSGSYNTQINNARIFSQKYRNQPQIHLNNVFNGITVLNIGQIYRIVDFNTFNEQILRRPFGNGLYIVDQHFVLWQNHRHYQIREQILVRYNERLNTIFGNHINVLRFIGTTTAVTQSGFHREVLTFEVPDPSEYFLPVNLSESIIVIVPRNLIPEGGGVVVNNQAMSIIDSNNRVVWFYIDGRWVCATYFI